jgi:hypothetical protein
MADTTPSAERPAESAPPKRIAVTNTSRNQPIVFHFVGGSMRLAPLETGVLDGRCLTSPELSHLVATGVVSLSEPAPAAAGRSHEAHTPAVERGGPIDHPQPPTDAETREE